MLLPAEPRSIFVGRLPQGVKTVLNPTGLRYCTEWFVRICLHLQSIHILYIIQIPEKGGRKPASVSWGLLVEVLKVLILGDVVVACFGFYVLKRTWGESNPTVTKLPSGT